MSGSETLIVFGGAVVLAVLLLIFGPAAVAKFLSTYLKMIFPILGRRASPELEAKAQEHSRQGGTGAIPLPDKRPGRRKWLFGKGGIFGARDEKATTPKGDVQDR